MNNRWFDSVRHGNAFEGHIRTRRPITITRWMRFRLFFHNVMRRLFA